LEDSAKYCSSCGAKVVHDRLTVKRIWKDFIVENFGWDNRFLKTVRYLFLQPNDVIKSYLNGTRKKFTPPIPYFAIMTALCLIVFTFFSRSYLDAAEEMSMSIIESIEEFFNVVSESNPNFAAPKDMPLEEYEAWQKEQREFQASAHKGFLKYFNLFTFISLPLYGLIAFFVYRKPYNYAEHLAIASYLQGTGFLFTILCFIISIFISPSAFIYSILLTIIYYLYVYGRLYNHGVGTIFLKGLKFIFVMILAFLAYVILILILAIGAVMIRKLFG